MTEKTKKTVFIVVGIVAVSALVYFLFLRKKGENENVGTEVSSIPEEVQKLARDFEDGESLLHKGNIYDMYSGSWNMR